MIVTARLLMALALVLCGVACTHVPPWQRGILARPEMALVPNPIDQLMRNHNYSSREAAPAGAAAVGGGCGCY